MEECPASHRLLASSHLWAESSKAGRGGPKLVEAAASQAGSRAVGVCPEKATAATPLTWESDPPSGQWRESCLCTLHSFPR